MPDVCLAMEIKAGCQMPVYRDTVWVLDACLLRKRLGARCLFSYGDKGRVSDFCYGDTGWVSDVCLVEIKAGCQMSV